MMTLFLSVFFFSGRIGRTQTHSFLNPLPIEPILAGNYGELRPNHFHAGLDLKTAGREGLEVKASQEGFVSRVRVSPYGYGQAIYVDHPNGYTTVYGHLQRFSPKIEAFVKSYQREQRSFEIDLYPGSDDLPVQAGELIAWSGNTGGSGGSHLHFEIRETKSEVPRNPIVLGFPIEDHKKPVVQAIGIAPLNGGSVNGSDKTFHARTSGSSLSGRPSISVEGPFGIEVNGYDSQDGSYNHNGIYRIELFVDDQAQGSFIADSVSFDLSRHLNALIDYSYYFHKRQRFIRLYRLPGNRLENITFENDGILDLPAGVHSIQVISSDVDGNETTISFDVNVKEAPKEEMRDGEILEWDVPYLFESDAAHLFIPAGAIYEDIPLKINVEETQFGSLLEVQDPYIPVQSPFEIRLKVPDGMERDGLMIGQLNSNDRVSRVLASSEDGEWIRAMSRSFGRFRLVHETKAPRIVSVNFSNGRTWNSGQMRFQVKDDLSGIERYDAYVDGEWVIVGYEPKQDLLFVDVNDLPKKKEKQQFKLIVEDLAGNVATFEGYFLHP